MQSLNEFVQKTHTMWNAKGIRETVMDRNTDLHEGMKRAEIVSEWWVLCDSVCKFLAKDIVYELQSLC